MIGHSKMLRVMWQPSPGKDMVSHIMTEAEAKDIWDGLAPFPNARETFTVSPLPSGAAPEENLQGDRP